MKEYIIRGLDDMKEGVLFLCLSHENVFSFFDEVQHEPVVQNGKGYILLDQLLVTGNGENRFVSIPYDHGEIHFSRAHNASVDPSIRKLSVELLRDHVESLHNTILTDLQQEMVLKRIVI